MNCECDKNNSYWCIECDWHRKEKNMQSLVKIYEQWRIKNHFDSGCSEELYIKLLDNPQDYKPQLKFLKKFNRIWEIAEHGRN